MYHGREGKVFVEYWEAILTGARAFERIVCWRTTLLGLMLAAFDESGKLADTACVSFAGFIAEMSMVTEMSVKWQRIINAHGIDHIRMTDALRFQNEFDGWKKDRRAERDALLIELIEMAQAHTAMFVATPMSCAEFKAITESQRTRLKNPQYCGFEGCLKILSGDAAKLGHQLQLYCDSSEEYSATCLALYNKLRLSNQQIKDTCVSITFADDKRFAPLQLADVFASCSRQDAMREVVRPDPIVDRLLEIFRKGGSVGGFVHYKPGHGLGDAVIE